MLTTAANANKATFEITDAKLYDPSVTLSIEDYAKLSKLLGEGIPFQGIPQIHKRIA